MKLNGNSNLDEVEFMNLLYVKKVSKIKKSTNERSNNLLIIWLKKFKIKIIKKNIENCKICLKTKVDAIFFRDFEMALSNKNFCNANRLIGSNNDDRI